MDTATRAAGSARSRQPRYQLRFGRALVIRGGAARARTTEPHTFNAIGAACAWIAEMRGGAVR